MRSKRPREFNPYAVGNVVYNGSNRSPHSGMKLDPMGYKERDSRAKVRRNSILRRLKAQNIKNFNHPDWLRDKG